MVRYWDRGRKWLYGADRGCFERPFLAVPPKRAKERDFAWNGRDSQSGIHLRIGMLKYPRRGKEIMKQRRQHSAELKAKVVLEMLRGQRTTAEISSHYQVHPNQITKWKTQALEGLPGIFARKSGNGNGSGQELIDELYREIGQMKVELDWLKKKSGVIR